VTEPVEAGSWRPTRALGRAVLLSGVLVLLAVLLGRVDLIVLAAPLALGVAWGLRDRPTKQPRLEVVLPTDSIAEGGEVQALIRVGNPNRVPFDVAVLRVRHSPWLRLPLLDRPLALRPEPGRRTQVSADGTALRGATTTSGPPWGTPSPATLS